MVGKEGVHDRARFTVAMATQKGGKPSRREEDVTGPLNILEHLQAWQDVLEGSLIPERMAQVGQSSGSPWLDPAVAGIQKAVEGRIQDLLGRGDRP